MGDIPPISKYGRNLPFYAPAGSFYLTMLYAVTLGFFNSFYSAIANSYTNTAAVSFKLYINESYVARGQPAGLSSSALLWYWDTVLNSSFLGWFLGNFFTPVMNDYLGRRAALLYSNFLILVANIINVVAIPLQMPELFLASRVLGYCFTSVNFGALTLIIIESPPTAYRGTSNFVAGTSYTAAMVLGMVLGMDVVMGTHLTMLVASTLIGTVLAVVTAYWTPDTPKFLLLMRNDRQKALESLLYYQGPNVDHEKLLDEILLEEDQADKGKAGAAIISQTKELFCRSHLRNAMILGLVALHLTVGIWPITTELLSAHFDQETAQFYSTAMYLCNFIAGLVGIYTIDRMPRRVVLIGSSILNVSSMAAYTLFDRLAKAVSPHFRYAALTAMGIYNVAFGIGLGTIAFYITGELLPQRYRSTGQSVVFTLALLLNWGFMFVTLPAYTQYDVWSFIPLFVLPGTFCLYYLWRYMPETANREIYEIVDELKRRYGKKSYGNDNGVTMGKGAATATAEAGNKEKYGDLADIFRPPKV